MLENKSVNGKLVLSVKTNDGEWYINQNKIKQNNRTKKDEKEDNNFVTNFLTNNNNNSDEELEKKKEENDRTYKYNQTQSKHKKDDIKKYVTEFAGEKQI